MTSQLRRSKRILPVMVLRVGDHVEESDRAYIARRLIEETERASCVAGEAGTVHRLMAEEYQRRLNAIDTSQPSALPDCIPA